MLNAEHYHDPTASRAIEKLSRRELNASRNQTKYYTKPVYVASKPRNMAEKPPEISNMNMEELSPYINSCAKACMDPMKCIDCGSQCVYGKRAVELMEQETKPKKVNRGTITMRMKAMQEYQAAIDSGDVLKYAIEHAKSKDPKRAKAAAAARVAFWRKNYGALIKETPKKDPVPVEKVIAEEPKPLIDMPCLSKKVAAERAAAEAKSAESASIVQVFAEKLESLRKAVADIQRQVEELNSNKDSIEQQIATIEATAGLLGVAI